MKPGRQDVRRRRGAVSGGDSRGGEARHQDSGRNLRVSVDRIVIGGLTHQNGVSLGRDLERELVGQFHSQRFGGEDARTIDHLDAGEVDVARERVVDVVAVRLAAAVGERTDR